MFYEWYQKYIVQRKHNCIENEGCNQSGFQGYAYYSKDMLVRKFSSWAIRS